MSFPSLAHRWRSLLKIGAGTALFALPLNLLLTAAFYTGNDSAAAPPPPAVAAAVAGDPGPQPIAYSHNVHIRTVGMTCTDCHVNVEKMPVATIPNIDVCQTCHNDQPLSKSPEELKLLRFVKDNTVIPWKQIYSVPDHVYFSHRRHVADGGLDCPTCHGNMAEMTAPVSRQIVPISMDNCLQCHKQRKVSTDCLSCHR